MNEQTNNRIRDEWDKFVESQVWQGEDEFTKNMGVGNVADWWLQKITELLKSQKDNLIDEMGINKIKDAWEIQGISPQYHLHQINRLEKEWHTLYSAIQNLLSKIKEE